MRVRRRRISSFMPRLVVGMLPVGMMIFGAATLCAQTYPSKIIRILTSGAGGGSDLPPAVFAPPGTPANLIRRLNEEIVRVLDGVTGR